MKFAMDVLSNFDLFYPYIEMCYLTLFVVLLICLGKFIDFPFLDKDKFIDFLSQLCEKF